MAKVLRRVALGEERAFGAPVFVGLSKAHPGAMGIAAGVELYSRWDRRSNSW